MNEVRYIDVGSSQNPWEILQSLAKNQFDSVAVEGRRGCTSLSNDEPQEFRGHSITRIRESPPMESNVAAKSANLIRVDCWNLQRCSGVQCRLCFWSEHPHPGLKPFWLEWVHWFLSDRNF